jgi:hypothetical protein
MKSMRTNDSWRDGAARLQGYVPLEHPFWRVRSVIDAALGTLYPLLRTTAPLSARCVIGPEQMMRALLLRFLFAMSRDRQLIDQIWCSMLFRWFVGVRPDASKWDLGVFAIYREQMLKQDFVRELLLRGLTEAQRLGLLSPKALAARRCELAQYAADVSVGVGRPGALPASPAQRTSVDQAGRTIAVSDTPA